MGRFLPLDLKDALGPNSGVVHYLAPAAGARRHTPDVAVEREDKCACFSYERLTENGTNVRDTREG